MSDKSNMQSNVPYVNLLSCDGVMYAVDLPIANCFGTIRSMMQARKNPEDRSSFLPLANVSGAILLKLLHWAKHHMNDPEPIDDGENNGNISAWDAEFLNVDINTLLELTTAADYLDIKGLLAVGCQTVANMIMGKTVEEIRMILGIQVDLPKEEESEEDE